MSRTSNEIVIVSVGQVDAGVLDYLTFVLSSGFNARCEISGVKLDSRGAFNAKRQQFDANQILQQLALVPVREGQRVLGVTESDLFVPIFTFVFGLSQVRGRAALMSTCRLHQEFYGLPEDNHLFLMRCEKEAAHELGHAFGLVHCPSYACVMHFSNSIEQVDVKAATFCNGCSALVPATVVRQDLQDVAR